MNEIFFRVFVYINARFWEILHESPNFFLNIVGKDTIYLIMNR